MLITAFSNLKISVMSTSCNDSATRIFRESINIFEFLKNMTVFSRLNLYSNYLKDPQNVDISWDVQLNMAINQWFSCNITTNMIYDNDTKILQKDGTKGPRLQFKEALAVGFQVTF